MQCQSRYVDEFKSYKKALEDYTQSPLPTYKYIAITAFGIPSVEVPTEAAFVNIMDSWWQCLSKQAQQYPFDDEGVKILMENIQSGMSAKLRFLEVIPTRWKDIEQLPAYIPTNWEEWSDTQIRAVANEYERCIRIVSEWKPAVSEADYVREVGRVFGLSSTNTVAELQQALKDQWLPTLPERTRTAPWAGMQSIQAQFMTYLSEPDFYEFITRILPKEYGLQSLLRIDDVALLVFSSKLETLKLKIETYRRPLEELIGILAKRQYDSVADYQNTLYAAIRSSDAYTNTVEKDYTLIFDEISRLILAEVRRNQPFAKLVSMLAEKLELPTDHHAWTKEEQLQFVRNINEHVKLLETWQFPQDPKMKEAKTELSKLIWGTYQNYNLSLGQIQKIISEILEEQPKNER